MGYKQESEPGWLVDVIAPGADLDLTLYWAFMDKFVTQIN